MPKKEFDHIPDSPKHKRRSKRKMKKKSLMMMTLVTMNLILLKNLWIILPI